MQTSKVVLHLHTNYSPDATTSLEDLIVAVHAQGIHCVAVTDHDTIRSAQALAARADFRVIIGQEVTTRDGHMIGLFLHEEIPAGLGARETARRIHAQGGLVLAPHPFTRMCDGGLGDVAEQIVDCIDAVEVSNAQSLIPADDRKAARFAARHGLPVYVGSDSHLPCSIAPCWQTMSAFSGPASFLKSLRHATLNPALHPMRYFAEYALRALGHDLLRIPSRTWAANASAVPAVTPDIAEAA